MFLSILVFIVMLSTLVFVHELGHFLVAKWTGMRVDEFNIGFPPRLFSRRKGDTLYSINWILLGGYVKIHGEDPSSQIDDDSRSFSHKSVWARMAVIVAGVTMNLLFAFLVLTVAFSIGFVSVSQDLDTIPGAVIKHTQVVALEVLPNSPVSGTHLQPGDFITGLEDSEGLTEITSSSQLQAYTKAHQISGDRQVKISFDHNGQKSQAPITLSASGPALGVAIDNLKTVRVPFWRAPEVAVKEIHFIASATFDALKNFASRLFIHAQLDHSVSGPVGVYKATSSATQQGVVAVVFLGVVLSISLAVFNMLPVPSLDGGRLVFLLIELVFRKKVIAEKVEGFLHLISFAALMLLIAVITFNDIRALF